MLLCWFFLFLPRNKMRWMKSGFILMIIIFVTVNQLMYNFLWRRERFVQHSDYCHLRTFCERISVWKSVQATFFFVIICKKPFLVTNKRAFGLQRRYNSKWKYLCAKEVTNNNINVCNHKWVPFGLLDWKSLDLSSYYVAFLLFHLNNNNKNQNIMFDNLRWTCALRLRHGAYLVYQKCYAFDENERKKERKKVKAINMIIKIMIRHEVRLNTRRVHCSILSFAPAIVILEIAAAC